MRPLIINSVACLVIISFLIGLIFYPFDSGSKDYEITAFEAKEVAEEIIKDWDNDPTLKEIHTFSISNIGKASEWRFEYLILYSFALEDDIIYHKKVLELTIYSDYSHLINAEYEEGAEDWDVEFNENIFLRESSVQYNWTIDSDKAMRIMLDEIHIDNFLDRYPNTEKFVRLYENKWSLHLLSMWDTQQSDEENYDEIEIRIDAINGYLYGVKTKNNDFLVGDYDSFHKVR